MSLFSANASAAAPVTQQSFGAPAVGYAPSTLVFGFGGVYDTMLQCPQRHYLSLGVLDPPGAYDCNRCKAHRPRGENHYQCRACDYDICVQCRPVYAHQQQQSAPDFTLLEKLERLRTLVEDTKASVRSKDNVDEQRYQYIVNRLASFESAIAGIHVQLRELNAVKSVINPSIITEPPTAPPRPVVAA